MAEDGNAPRRGSAGHGRGRLDGGGNRAVRGSGGRAGGSGRPGGYARGGGRSGEGFGRAAGADRRASGGPRAAGGNRARGAGTGRGTPAGRGGYRGGPSRGRGPDDQAWGRTARRGAPGGAPGGRRLSADREAAADRPAGPHRGAGEARGAGERSAGRGEPRRDWSAGSERGYGRRPGPGRPGRPGREPYGGGYRAGQAGRTGRTGTFPPDRADRPDPARRPGDPDRTGRGPGGNMSGRPGGAFPRERPERRGAPRGGRPERREYDRGRRDDRRGERREAGAGRPRRATRPGPGDRQGQRRHVPAPGARRAERSSARPEAALPRIPDSITEDQLSREAKAELRGLPADLAATVGRYLVAAERESDSEQAYRYAQAARRLAARIGVVREVSGVTAYRTGRWAEALAELRAARRMTGRGEYLPLMADSERALGRLDRALELVHGEDAKRLPRAAQIELRIVESGIRRDQGLADAAVLALQVPELADERLRPWSARLFYAYGDALLAAGRPAAAREAFSRAVVADEDEETDALARLDALDGITVEDLEDLEDLGEGQGAAGDDRDSLQEEGDVDGGRGP